MTLDLAIDHLWQSTLFAAVLALLTLAFRRCHARARYAIWLGASLKFLIPFAALTSLGAQLKWQETLPRTSARWTDVIEAVSQPLVNPPIDIVLLQTFPARTLMPVADAALVCWGAGCLTVLGIWLVRWRRLSRTVRRGAPIVSGRTHDTFRALASTAALPLIESNTSLEPGVFGILRPVLLWPRAIDRHLDDAQVRAVLAHELAHVRRRDNLTAALHMVVEAVFWFHPLVWWIGARLVDERERACDEEVVRLGNDPDVYAQSILKTCQLFVESPLSCVPGVTGSDLKKRIERIMANRPGKGVSRWVKGGLVTAAIVTIAAPVGVGALTAPRRPPVSDLGFANREPSVDAPGGLPARTRMMRVIVRVQPDGGFEATNVTLESMIRMAYRIQEPQLVGGPDWIYNERFDIATAPPQDAQGQDIGPRMQSLLAERFNLTLHRETRELPIYALISDGGHGPRLKRSAIDCHAWVELRKGPPAPAPGPAELPICGTTVRPGRLSGSGSTMAQLAQSLSQYAGRMVVDQTGLSGSFDFDLEFDAVGGAIFTAMHEQLGLRLDSQRAAVDVLVVDSADRPEQN